MSKLEEWGRGLWEEERMPTGSSEDCVQSDQDGWKEGLEDAVTSGWEIRSCSLRSLQESARLIKREKYETEACIYCLPACRSFVKYKPIGACFK